jgi:putative intracellular protease/amidase
MKDKSKSTAEEGLTRRRFMKGGAGAVVAAGCLHGLKLYAATAGTGAGQSATARAYVCPPCGMPCDRLRFDKPGQCPSCNMTLVPADGEGGPPRVAILVFNGIELIDFAGPWEVFGTAGFLVHTVAENPEPLTAVFGQKMIPDYTFDNAPKADILLVPGGGNVPFSNNQKLIGWIQDKSKQVSHVMSVCTGAFLLAKAGMLEGKTVTATTGMIEDLQTPQTKVVYNQRYVDNGKIITTAGLSSGIDGALHLVSKILGKGAAQRVALGMEYRWDPDGKWARAALADLYMPARIKGMEALIISYEGDDGGWEIKFLVSQPRSSAEIVTLLRESIAGYKAIGGMMGKRTPHIRVAPTFEQARTNGSEISWKFTDDQGRDWNGVGVVEPAPDDRSKFIATLKIARQS